MATINARWEESMTAYFAPVSICDRFVLQRCTSGSTRLNSNTVTNHPPSNLQSVDQPHPVHPNRTTNDLINRFQAG